MSCDLIFKLAMLHKQETSNDKEHYFRMSNLELFVTRAETAEREIEILAAELEKLKQAPSGGGGVGGDREEDLPEELKKLRQENTRLKYRLNILRRAVEEETSGRSDCL